MRDKGACSSTCVLHGGITLQQLQQHMPACCFYAALTFLRRVTGESSKE